MSSKGRQTTINKRLDSDQVRGLINPKKPSLLSIIGIVIAGLILAITFFSLLLNLNIHKVLVQRTPLGDTPTATPTPMQISPTPTPTPTPTEEPVEYSLQFLPIDGAIVGQPFDVTLLVLKNELPAAGEIIAIQLDPDSAINNNQGDLITDADGHLVLSITPNEPGILRITASLGEKSVGLDILVQINDVDTDEDGWNDVFENEVGTDPGTYSLYKLLPPQGSSLRKLDAPETPFANIYQNVKVLALPAKTTQYESQSTDYTGMAVYYRGVYKYADDLTSEFIIPDSTVLVGASGTKEVLINGDLSCQFLDPAMLPIQINPDIPCQVVDRVEDGYVVVLTGFVAQQNLLLCADSACIAVVTPTQLPNTTSVPPTVTEEPTEVATEESN